MSADVVTWTHLVRADTPEAAGDWLLGAPCPERPDLRCGSYEVVRLLTDPDGWLYWELLARYVPECDLPQGEGD